MQYTNMMKTNANDTLRTILKKKYSILLSPLSFIKYRQYLSETYELNG